MKKPASLVTISRREFCEGLATCLGIATIAACSDSGGNGAVDAAVHPDSGGATCSTGATDVGAPAMFTLNKPVFIAAGNFFVVRDAGGLYALTARCTHEGVTTVVQGSDFFCPRHGAQFDFTGAVVNGPASTPLVHFAMCTLANGHVGVMTTQVVPKTDRLNA